MKYDLKEMLRDADLRAYAVPAFNFSDCWELQAILQAAFELKAPVIAASNMQVVSVHGAELLGKLSDHYTGNAQTPVIFHLDHSRDAQLCKTMVRYGYPSVMFDGSEMPLEDNIRLCREVSDFAHNAGACVEAEIGRIIGQNEESEYAGQDYLGTVDNAVRLAKEGRCDSLAVGLGNAHGFYCERPKLRFDRLAEINGALDTPLVLHGGTGIPEEDIQRAIKNGVNKVNVGTELHFTYVNSLKELLTQEPLKPNVLTNMLPVVEAVKEPVKRWIKTCMADNKA